MLVCASLLNDGCERSRNGANDETQTGVAYIVRSTTIFDSW